MWSTVTLKKETLELLSVFQEWVGLHLVRGVVEEGVPPKGTGMSEGLEMKDIRHVLFRFFFFGGGLLWFCVFGWVFLFLATPHSMWDLSSLTRD